MARYSDEVYDYIQDCADKKVTARSARSTRTHCGKGGKVKFVSDYMSAKERNAMNGECVKYASLKKPMTWAEFKALPDDLKVCYIKSLRKMYDVPDLHIAAMMGASKQTLVPVFAKLNLNKEHRGRRSWNKEGWLAWVNGADPDAVKPSETPVEDGVEDADETPVEDGVEETKQAEQAGVMYSVTEATDGGYITDHTCSYTIDCRNSVPVIPAKGTMTFMNNEAYDALTAVKTLLGDMRVNMTVTWWAAEEGETRHE